MQSTGGWSAGLARVALIGVATALATCAPPESLGDDPMDGGRVGPFANSAAGLAALFAPGAKIESCPKGMVLVSGAYCPEVEQTCLRWLDPPGQYHQFRCAEYAKPAVCRASRTLLRYCIDRDEQRLAGSTDPRPSNNVTYVAAQDACAARGAHVCTDSEWTFACEGEEMRPYPYGFARDATACNIDRTDLGFPNGGLRDHRTAPGDNPRCTSPFGVRDMAGNLEEWATNDSGRFSKKTLLKGSWWLPGRSTCRAGNAGHDEAYHGTETGFRCCK